MKLIEHGPYWGPRPKGRVAKFETLDELVAIPFVKAALEAPGDYDEPPRLRLQGDALKVEFRRKGGPRLMRTIGYLIEGSFLCRLRSP